jgi:uncharacterized protein
VSNVVDLDACPVDTEDDLRRLVGFPSHIVLGKVQDHIDGHARAFIAACPMVIVSSADSRGRCDVSPRGDPPGFVKVLDGRTLLIPDRKGNRRADTMSNILENPHLGILFLVPGNDVTLRVSGRAGLTSDDAILGVCAVEGKRPALGVVVDVEELFFHCARAFRRSGLWDPARWPNRSGLSTYGTILVDHAALTDRTAEQMDAELEVHDRDLY